MSEFITLDNSRFTTMIVDPTVVYDTDRKVMCNYCGNILFTMNRKFAVIADGASPMVGMDKEVPLSVFRFTRMCGDCRHYYIIYFDRAYDTI